MRFKFNFCSKGMKTIQAIKICFDVISLNNVYTFLLEDNAILPFLHLKLLIELFAFHNLN